MTGDASSRVVRRILRVNHAGEHGAVAIFTAQLARFEADGDLRRWLAGTLAHEQKHRSSFREAMPERGAKPCRALWVWSFGGAWLGQITALLGPDAVLACTAAVERTVHAHLVEQAGFLDTTDPALAALVRSIQVEEDEHLAYAEARHDPKSALAKAISAVVTIATETLIALSTRGDSLGLKRALAR